MNNNFTMVLAWIAIAVIFIGGVVSILALTNNFTCHRYGRMTGREVRTAFPGDCYVKTDKGWFTLEQIRNY